MPLVLKFTNGVSPAKSLRYQKKTRKHDSYYLKATLTAQTSRGAKYLEPMSPGSLVANI